MNAAPLYWLRFVMVCCAADVQPLAVTVEYPKSAPDFESMSWVKVVGKVRFQPLGKELAPALEASKVTPIPNPPRNTSIRAGMKIISILLVRREIGKE